MRRVLFVALLALVIVPCAARSGAAQGDELARRLRPVRIKQRGELSKMAADAIKKGYPSLARRCWVLAGRAGEDLAETRIAELADEPDGAKLDAKKRAGLEKPFVKHRVQMSKHLGDVGRWCAENDRDDDAQRLAREALELDPQNADARGILGQRRLKGWGWVSGEDAAQLSKGLVRVGGEWVKKAGAAKRARSAETPWEVVSDHWRIHSNLELARVFELRDLLERFHERWVADWEGTLPLVAAEEPHVVLIFAAESEYTADLEKNDPQHIKNVPGQYSPRLRRASFWDVETLRQKGGQVSGLGELMLHECAHQLFRERVKGNHLALEGDGAPNFWVHEGISELYGMHVPAKAGLVLDAKRVRGQLRTRHLRDHFASMPSPSSFDSMTRKAFQGSDPVTRTTHYAAAGFLCLFLEQGPHRSAFRFLVRDVYCGGNEKARIADRLGDLPKLDAAFKKYVRGF